MSKPISRKTIRYVGQETLNVSWNPEAIRTPFIIYAHNFGRGVHDPNSVMIMLTREEAEFLKQFIEANLMDEETKGDTGG